MNNIISLHGSYFGDNYGDTLLMNLFSTWVKEFDSALVVNMPLAKHCTAVDLKCDTKDFFPLFRAKGLVFCGGGYFGEQPVNPHRWAKRNFFRHALLGLFAILFHKPYAIIGVEFGPISVSWFRKVCVYIAKHAKVVVVRNRQSVSFLEQNGVHNVKLSYDAVLSLSDIYNPIQTKNQEKQILLHFNGLKISSDELRNIITKICDAAAHSLEKYKFYFISDSKTSVYDTPKFQSIFLYLSNNDVPYKVIDYQTCNSLISIINNSDFIFTNKLHVGITAASLNKRVFSLWTHPKTERLHSQIHNGDFCMALSKFETLNVDSILYSFFKSSSYTLPQEVKTTALVNKIQLYGFLKSIL